MKSRIIAAFIGLILITASAVAQTGNRLIVNDITAGRGSTVSLPVVMENTAEVVAVQFTLEMPEGATLYPQQVVKSGRLEKHTVSSREVAHGKYTFIIMSADNEPISGYAGQLFTIPLRIGESMNEGHSYPMAISEAVMSLQSGGDVLEEATAGTISVSRSTDFIVKSVSIEQASASPGEEITVSWSVSNNGELDAKSGWHEQLMLVSFDGSEERLIGTVYNESTLLQAGSTVQRSATVMLPQLPGIDGDVRVRVRLVPNGGSGERPEAQGNNSADSQTLLSLAKRLVLQMPAQVSENGGQTVECKLMRTGSWKNEETFSLSTDGDSRISLPSTITIPARQSGAVFSLSITDNELLDSKSIVVITAEGSGYPVAQASLVIEDNEYPDLTVTASKTEITEGETFQLTVTTSRVSTQPIVVTLTSEHPQRFSYPRQVTIPAGETSVTVEVTAIADDLPGEELSSAFMVSASGYNKGEAIVLLQDDDMPVLELMLTPNKVQEGAGPVSIAAVLRRTTNKDSRITVRLSDDSNGGLYFSTRELVLAKGVEEAVFNFGPVENVDVDGSRTYNITAAVWLSSCSCSAAGQSAGSVSAQLEVLDDDGPALTLTSTLSTILEGGQALLTVGRNTLSSLDQPLTVTLTSDYDENLTYEHTVIIPAGQQTVQVEITSTNNDVSEDSHTVVFTAQSDGYATATCWLMVTDQTLPDAIITSISVAEQEVEAGGIATVSITVKNGGAAVLPAQTPIDFFISSIDVAVGSLFTLSDIEPGMSVTMTKMLKIPAITGSKYLFCVVNNSRDIKELVYSNNTSGFVSIELLSPYSATVACDKIIYLSGEPIYMNGIVEGNVNLNSEVEVYLINDGVRQSLIAHTDSEGKFSLSYTPYVRQMGHFKIGACYPGEGATIEQGAFDYIGIRRTTQKYIKCDIVVGTPYHGTIEVENPTSLSQHNISVEVLSAPENCSISFMPVSVIGAGDKYALNYTIEGSSASEGKDWQEIEVRIVSDEGASTEMTMYCYCRMPEAQLALDVTEINTTITKGIPRDYPITITNNGAGETGTITMSLPANIQMATPQNIASLKNGETVTILLRLTTTVEMPLNVPYVGQIGINCEHGNGIALPFTLLPVAETQGTLIVDVCDEYTYYTEEAPHVKGAKVIVKYPYSDEVVATGTTDENGLFTAELSEGYYALSVSADKHETYQNNLLIDPGRENKKVINLSYEGITVNWNVEETEVEDVYDITSTITYETNVPEPIVVTKLPDYIPVDSMAPGETRLFYATLTNKGLITAENVQMLFPEIEYMEFEPLIEFPLNILPQQAIAVPFKVTLDENVPLAHGSSEERGSRKIQFNAGTLYGGKYKVVCELKILTLWYWFCGDDYKKKWTDTGIPMGVDIKCHLTGGNTGGDEIENDPPYWYDGFIWLGGSGSSQPGHDNKECKKCLEAFKDAVFDGFDDFVAGLIPRCWAGTVNCVIKKDLAGGGKVDVDVIDCADDGIKCYALNQICLALIEGGPEAPIICSAAISALQYAIRLLTWPTECMGIEIKESRIWGSLLRTKEATEPLPSFIVAMEEKNNALIRQINGVIDFYREIFGSDIWLNVEAEELVPLFDALYQHGSTCEVNAFKEYKPEIISDDEFEVFIHRINNTFFDGNYVDGGKVDANKLHNSLQAIIDEDSIASHYGFSSCTDMWLSEYDNYRKTLLEESSSVCASVTLEIKQTMTLNRPAYRGTLTVFNGHDDTPMTDVRLDLVVKDDDGNVATSNEFQINLEGLDGFAGDDNLDGVWSLEAQQSGTATVLFIPTNNAAPTEPKNYSFGGTLSYIDPFTGLEKSMKLLPQTLTVNPLSILDLTYFMQRDIYGDDPLTINAVEPMKPAEFALLINNKGFGDATNVRMVTQQPEIIDNEKGLFITFEIDSTQVNGGDATLSFGQSIANDFGTIPAHSQMYAQWWLTSTLLGHFTAYNVEATHVTSYGNENLSLLDQVTIHELIHGFDMPAGSLTGGPEKGRAFLVNDVTDADDLPDRLYFSNGETADVGIAASATANRTSPTTCLLTVTPSEAGWNYGSVLDPTHGYAELKSIVRQSDGMELGSTRFWQTDRTLRDGKDWLYEYRLHFVDEFASQTAQTYLLTFEPVPETVLEVASIGVVPAEGEIAEEPIETLTVTFNKGIDASTFTGDDITFNVQGVKQDASQIGISTQDNRNFTLDMSGMNDMLPNGYYTMSVQTADITDAEGYQGKNGKQVGWIMFRGGLVQLQTSAYPAMSGTVSRRQSDAAGARETEPNDGNDDAVAYGSVVTLDATPATGYKFLNWTLNGKVVSTDEAFETTALGDMNVVANFTKKNYMVNIGVEGVGGTTEGTATGIYEHGTPISVTAIPDEDYILQGWTVNGEPAEGSGELTLVADQALDIQASFLQEYYRQSMTMARGWNWISAYLSEPLPVTELSRYANRILSQTDELINDPEYGMVGGLTELTAGQAYKIEAVSRFSNSFRGHLYDTTTKPITLHKGWNWIAFPFMERGPVTMVTNAEEGDFITSQTGFAEYADGTWAGTLDMFTPGSGYLYKSVESKQLAFNPTMTVSQSRSWGARTPTVTEQDIDIHRYPSTMNVTADICRDGAALDGNGYTIYALVGDELRGISQCVDGHHYLTVYGDAAAEISFVIENAETGENFEAGEKLMFRSDVVGSRKSPFAFNMGNATGIDSFDGSTRMTVYTLEGILVSRDATLKTLHRLPKGVYIVNGRKCFIK